MSFSRRRFLQAGAAIGATSALAVAGDGIIFEANRPRLVSIEVPLPRLAESWDGFRIAQISDLHYDDHFSVLPLRRAIDLINQSNPDLVVVTGDFITASSNPHLRSMAMRAIVPCAQLLTQIKAPCGIVGALGNHDVITGGKHVTAVLESHNVAVLRNRSLALEREGQRLWLAGVDDVLEGKPDLDLTLKAIPQGEPVILLAHEPDWADHAARSPVDLQLSGHSHGGQVRLPLIGAPWLPVMGQKYPWGLRRIGPLTLYTNIGIGTIWFPMRLGCPPEVTLITLRAASAASLNA